MEIKECKSFYSRLMGFMFKKNINEILMFPKCNSIHTFFMSSKIDVYMTDKNNKILFIYKSLTPWKIILPKRGVYYTYETPVDYYNYKIGDVLKKELN